MARLIRRTRVSRPWRPGPGVRGGRLILSELGRKRRVSWLARISLCDPQRTPFTNWSSASSKSSFATPSPPGCSAGDSGFFTTAYIINITPLRNQVRLTEFHIEVNIYLVQDVPHVGAWCVGKHHEFDAGGSFVVMQFVLTGAVWYEATRMCETQASTLLCRYPYLSSGPPSFRTMFRRENIVPNISFASSCALSLVGRALAGPRSGAAPLLATLEPDMGLVARPLEDTGLSCLAQSLE